SGLRELRRQGPVELRHESLDATRVQGALALGDRGVGEALLDMVRPGPSGFARALRRHGEDLETLLAPRDAGSPLPWDLIDDGIPPDLLRRELERAEHASACCLAEGAEGHA
ncbi:MAG: hypothetical protein JXA74_11790, partial [Anaerolineae bacterium]|nr:hypothetical protein [Anaerolineae bacterium]